MISEYIEPTSDACAVSSRWAITLELAYALRNMSGELPFRLKIISGYRTAEEQADLAAAGRPAAPDHLSTHRSCPATGVDVLPDIAVTNAVKATLGATAIRHGLRWGGGSPVDRQTGIPSDWNHLDLGPRLQ